MPTKTVDLKDFSKELKKFAEENTALYKKTVVDEAKKAIPRLVTKSPVDTGLFAQSWDMEVTEEGVVLGNYAPHAPYIENGARPFTPPIAPLLAWAKRVLQDGSQPPNYSQRVWQLARGTQKAIAERGLKPHHLLEDEMEIIMTNVLARMRGQVE